MDANVHFRYSGEIAPKYLYNIYNKQRQPAEFLQHPRFILVF